MINEINNKNFFDTSSGKVFADINNVHTKNDGK